MIREFGSGQMTERHVRGAGLAAVLMWSVFWVRSVGHIPSGFLDI